MGEDRTFHVNGRTVNAYLAKPEQDSGPGMLVLHAWWGLNEDFKRICDRLAQAGFVALAPDLYDGKVTASIEEADHLASEHIHSPLVARTLAASVDYLRKRTGRPSEAIGAIGFSLGGFWAMGLPEPLGAIVTFYSTTSPASITSQAAIQGHFAERDEFEPREQVQQFEQELRASGRQISFFEYPGTRHWFFEENRPEYDAEAAQIAWQRTIAFLQQQLS